MDSSQLKCPMCEAHFNSQDEMDSHVKQMHGNKDEQQEQHAIACSKCAMKAKSPQDLEAHEQQHSANS